MFKTLLILFIIIISAVGVLGFFSLSIMEHSEHAACPASAISAGKCLPPPGSFALTLYHLSIMKLISLSLGVISLGTILAGLSVLILAAAFIGAASRRPFLPLVRIYVCKKYTVVKEILFLSRQRLFFWINSCHKEDCLTPAISGS